MLALLFAAPRYLRDGILILVAVLALTGMAFAQQAGPPVKATIDMTQHIPGSDGQPIPGPDKKPDTVGHAISRVLMGLPDQKATLQDLLARAALAKRIEDNPKAELTAAETALIEKLLIEGYGTPAVISQIVPLIDPAAKPGEIKP